MARPASGGSASDVTGDTALTCLMLTLSVTPLRRLTGWNELIRVRRLIGLTVFWYACLHLTTYLVFDQSLSVEEILRDIVKHPWVLVGFTAFLCLVPLAITSTSGWVRRLGGKRWQRLHRLVYVVAVAGVLHYFWLVKKDAQAPLVYGAVLVVLLGSRVWLSRELARSRQNPSTRTTMMLQRRAAAKYHSGGLWSNACCSHPHHGEDHQASGASPTPGGDGIRLHDDTRIRISLSCAPRWWTLRARV